MQTIGEKLEEARKRKGISVREAAETTKIRGDYLQKFEANSFDLDLPPLYIRGFLRSYARYLDLDAERFLAEYDSVMASEGRTPRRESREVYGRVEFGETAGGEAPAGGRSAQDQAVMLKFGLLIGGAIVAILVIILLINVVFFRAPAKPAPAAPAATQAANPGENVLTLTALGPVRVKVVRVATNQILLDGLTVIAKGETRMMRYSDKLKVTVDDPTKLAMELNGRRQEVPIQQYGYFFIEP